MDGPIADPRAWIQANTRLSAPALTPEIRLWLAQEDLPIWAAGEEALAELGLATPYWAFAWAGGQALARHVLDNPALVAGKTVLSFAAGSGIEAIACARAFAADVVAADIDPMAATAIAMNALENDVFVTVVLEDLIGRHDDWEVVLIGDVCFEAETAARVLPWARSLAASGRAVLIGDPLRGYLKPDGLEALARYTAPTTGIMEDSALRNATVWRVAG